MATYGSKNVVARLSKDEVLAFQAESDEAMRGYSGFYIGSIFITGGILAICGALIYSGIAVIFVGLVGAVCAVELMMLFSVLSLCPFVDYPSLLGLIETEMSLHDVSSDKKVEIGLAAKENVEKYYRSRAFYLLKGHTRKASMVFKIGRGLCALFGKPSDVRAQT